MSKKILVTFGTRPEAIKMCALVHELKRSLFEVKVCVTAQHRQMLDQVLEFFDLVPDYDLDLMRPNQSLNELSGRIFTNFDRVLCQFVPDLVLVHGDTTSSTICALAAFHRGIKVGHVEAGLRTFDKQSPFPEEMNRQLTGKIADFHFAPTSLSATHLINENVKESDISVTGNTVIDSLLWTREKLNQGYINTDIERLQSLLDFEKKVVLVTGHRRENFGEGFLNICNALLELSEQPDVEIVYPVHLNPNVQKPVHELLSSRSNIHLIAPLEYPTFVWLMMRSYLILTDSGGIQEEAPSLGKPVLVMRKNTERPEAIEAGTVLLVGTDKESIVAQTKHLLFDEEHYEKMQRAHNPYGDGNANKRILSFLNEKLR